MSDGKTRRPGRSVIEKRKAKQAKRVAKTEAERRRDRSGAASG